MAASLRPAVSGATRKAVRRVTLMHGLGLVLGATFAGLVLVAIGSAVRGVGLSIFYQSLLFAALLVAVLQWFGLRLPQSSWQVPEYWRRHFDLDILPLAYGWILGMGVFTAVVVGAFWVFFVGTGVAAPATALLGWMAYAVGRVIGFRLALATPELETIFLTTRKRLILVILTTLLAALVAVT
jgi:hypothetical protein